MDLLENYHLTYVSLFLMMFFFPLFCVGFHQHLLLLKKGKHIFGLHEGVNTWPRKQHPSSYCCICVSILTQAVA